MLTIAKPIVLSCGWSFVTSAMLLYMTVVKTPATPEEPPPERMEQTTRMGSERTVPSARQPSSPQPAPNSSPGLRPK